jgi:hypothetical protein
MQETSTITKAPIHPNKLRSAIPAKSRRGSWRPSPASHAWRCWAWSCCWGCCCLLLSQHAAPVGADESAAPTKKNTSFSFHNTAGGRTLSSFSVNGAYSKKPVGKGN